MSLQIASHTEPIAGYRLIERIGGGGFGEVWKAEAPGGLLKAIKIIHGDMRAADPDGARHAEQELKALKRIQAIRHPYLLSLERYDIVEGRLLIVMELADCNLWDRFRQCRSQGLQGISRGELLRYLEESSEVLDLLNNQYGLQHLDIKPQNLFLSHNHVKVADFGLVKDLEGVRAAITGGVTPVYAAPETFDGVATRFCDQYSLAIVYQELLTGIRPFNGANSQQLLVQHLQGLPNLNPLPAADRAAVGRALAKKPEDRFPTCLQFVRALYQASGDPIGGALPGTTPSSATGKIETLGGNLPTLGAYGRMTAAPFPPAEAPPETPKTEPRFKRGDEANVSSPSIDFALSTRDAPAEQQGDGCLVPAVLIGIGRIGIDVVRNFRRQVVDRYGSFDRIANIRILCVDTDPETLQEAASTNSAAPLAPTEVFPMQLNRASHYLKPRRNGRSLIEGWFDPQMLYRIPRNPQTLGLRCLGRLALCDHYRAFAARLREELEECLNPDAIVRAHRHSKLGLRTNRPRVYVVAGLGGGTGGGMFLDIAYSARHKLRQLGYANPEVIGLLLVPPADRNGVKPHVIGNAFASLKELNHFGAPETVFNAVHDDRESQILDAAPPFTHCFVISHDDAATKPGDSPPADAAPRQAADFLRRDLLTPLGRAVDQSRLEFEQKQGGPVTVRVQNQASFIWPKQVILSRAARWLGESLVTRWLKTDSDTIREPVGSWLKERWNAEELGPEPILARLRQSAEKTVGRPLDDLFVAESQPYAPRGWFAREPDSAKLWQTVSKLVQIVGMPDEHAVQRQVGQLERSLNEAADEIARDLAPKLTRLPRSLLEHPDYRLSGAEEGVTQLENTIKRFVEHYEPLVVETAKKAVDAYYTVHSFLTAESGRRKPSLADVADCLANFPKWRYEALILHQVCRVYLILRGHLADMSREIQFCRQRLIELMSRFSRMPAEEAVTLPELTLFPDGCSSIEMAVESLRESIRPEEIRALDKAMQKQIEHAYQALFSVCMSSINMLGNLQGVVEEQTRAFLAARLGNSNVGAMFFARFTDKESALRAFRSLHERAVPQAGTSRPTAQEICAIAIPENDRTDAIQLLARQGLPGKVIDFTSNSEEILVYREWPRLPLTALPQLGAQAEDAYNQMRQAGEGAPHTRTDIAKWSDIDR